MHHLWNKLAEILLHKIKIKPFKQINNRDIDNGKHCDDYGDRTTTKSQTEARMLWD